MEGIVIMDKYEIEILNKIDNNQKLDSVELSSLVYEYELETDEGENRRWSRTNRTIVQLGNRYFSVIWEEGLTEYQPDDFNSQPIEVTKHEFEKTVIVTEWLPVKKG